MKARGLALLTCGVAAVAVVAVLAVGLLCRQSEEEPPPHVPGVELSSITDVSIRRTMDLAGGIGNAGPTGVDYYGTTLRDLIPTVLGFPKSGIVYESPVPEASYDIRITAPSQAALRDAFRAALRQVFRLSARTELRTREV